MKYANTAGLRWSRGLLVLLALSACSEQLSGAAFDERDASEKSAPEHDAGPKAAEPDLRPPIVAVSPAADRIYPAEIDVVLSADEPAEIYYTLDGSTPNEHALRFTEPIRLRASTQVAFMAIDGSGNRSSVEARTFRVDAARAQLLFNVAVQSP